MESNWVIEYDSYGRMKYNPLFHQNMKTPWKSEDLEYLKEWYESIGPEEMSFALERTIQSTMEMARKLREKGTMRKPLKQIHIRRVGGML